MKTKSNSFFIVYVGIFSILILIGIVLVFLGIKDTVQLNMKTKHYEKTTGYLSDYIMDSEGGYNPKRKTHSNPTYFLSYNYTVNGTEYTVTTDYSTSILPTIGTTREIRYNPSDPQIAVVIGPNGNTTMILVGALFAIVPCAFLIPVLSSGKKEKHKGKQHKKLPIDGFRLFLGLILAAFGYGALYLITGSFSIGEILDYYRTSFTFPLVIPPILLTVGLFTAVTAFFPKKLAEWQEKQKKYEEKMEDIKRRMDNYRH